VAVLGKKYLGGLAPHHLGSNNGYAKLLQTQLIQPVAKLLCPIVQ